MRRWWCAAGGLGRRVLSSSSAAAVASHARPLPPPVIPKSASFNAPFSMPCRRHHSLHAPLPLGLFHPAIASSFRPPSALQQQVRPYAKKERSRAPLTPTKSKVKKYKMKAPSSMKFRFRTMNDGQIRRWRAGKRHNAHLKSKEAKRRLRKPALVHLAYAKVIKKLNFCG
ncbi:uncharacterized protein LOC120692623 [Panicum virgatum]|uniref:50S ribosomal protein L35 n=1 Tax=Panicum virgatum TaxID=38727 RepID=A0A8T0MNP3_PANVG|nr:uncharacterized protein LOC120692623 [Panicum virgatum]KAG2539031.1 hypothetical protein PVAP13_9NG367200 [Panicum virgatum]